MTALEIQQTAEAKGFTRHITCTDGDCDLQGFIRPGADIDGTFILISDDDGCKLRVNGWLMTGFEDVV